VKTGSNLSMNWNLLLKCKNIFHYYYMHT
jgi:hypothetical protein